MKSKQDTEALRTAREGQGRAPQARAALATLQLLRVSEFPTACLPALQLPASGLCSLAVHTDAPATLRHSLLARWWLCSWTWGLGVAVAGAQGHVAMWWEQPSPPFI